MKFSTGAQVDHHQLSTSSLNNGVPLDIQQQISFKLGLDPWAGRVNLQN